jgi:hypothetical protein
MNYLSSIFACCIGITILLTSCTIQVTKNVVDELQPAELNKIYETKPPNLKILSKCPTPPSVNIVSIETKERHVVFRPGAVWEINPKEIITHVASYMKDAYERSGIAVDKDSSKSMQLSMDDAIISPSGFKASRTGFTLNINIPEKDYFARFAYIEASPRANHSEILAMSIHSAVWRVIEDRAIQDYILCRSEWKNPSKITVVSVKGYNIRGGNERTPMPVMTDDLAKKCNGLSLCENIFRIEENREIHYYRDRIAEWRCGNEPVILKAPAETDGGIIKFSLTCP